MKKKSLPWVAFLGADGAGKSTVIEAITARFESKGIKVYYNHWKPKSANQTKDKSTHADNPHEQTPRGPFLSIAKAIALVWIWKKEFKKQIRPLQAGGHLVLFDRYYDDMLADPLRYRYSGSLLLAKWIFKFMPKPGAVILLDAPVEVLLQRKQEVSERALEKVTSEYQKHVNQLPQGVIINADQPIKDVIKDTEAAINLKLSNDTP